MTHTRCIFCKQNSSSSTSREHIIPESLGNIEHVLPPGVVCDKCNNYFARKIEKPLLDSDSFRYQRFENLIQNKRKRIPNAQAFHLESSSILEIQTTANGLNIFLNEDDIFGFLDSTKDMRKGHLYIPHITANQDEYTLSRFICKAALEYLASLSLLAMEFSEEPSVLDVDIIDNEGLDPIRKYVRYGHSSKKVWPFHERRIYPADALFLSEEDGQYYDLPHEFSLLYSKKKDLFFVLAIFGVEYVIDMANQSNEAYLEWLDKNEYKSPLYMDGDIKIAARRGICGLNEGSILGVWTKPKK
jgi:hypothetical protein